MLRGIVPRKKGTDPGPRPFSVPSVRCLVSRGSRRMREPCAARRAAGARAARLPALRLYFTNSMSRYRGSGHRSSGSTRSSLSTTARTAAMAGTMLSRMWCALE